MRFLVRLFGYGLVALGFVTLVIDGARSIANSGLRFTAIGEALQTLLPERYPLIGPALARDIHPWLADPAFAEFARLPVAAALLALGFGLLWLGRAPQPTIGIVTRQ
ncbi:hypothetical protein [Bosea sp. (in: a-proteobacteria)]|uniref:hypothetical protein n=1 Tax=Bosea sp. (in: a-proteobacteria) TaxID=1871050 RepID=UPI0011F77EE9|nr:hypothetical protein [Bosea sp. (in: a-proteobacteria)]TAJ30707.1 MAG: hypothetical protein EPO59_10530 [Bosea sp. (in: a-proteobacteria)]